MVPKVPTRTLMSLSVESKKPLQQTEANTNRENELQKIKEDEKSTRNREGSKKDLIVHKP
jgi:hypothetical protein